jgi:hypothetical protein
MMDEIDEDSLDRESPEAVETPEPQIIRTGKRGRPKGYPKSPLSGRIKGRPTKRQTQEELRGKLWSVADEVFEFHLSVMRGELQKVAGPTGKQMWSPPTMAQRIESAQYLGHKMVPDLKSSEVLQANINAAADLTDAGANDIRKAIADAMGIPYGTNEPQPLLIEASAGENAADVIPAADAPEKIIDPSDGSTVISVTDLEQIKRWDRELAALEAKPSSNPNSKTFPNGFSWQKHYDEATRRDVYNLFNAQGQPCGVRRSEERADAWCLGEGSA